MACVRSSQITVTLAFKIFCGLAQRYILDLDDKTHHSCVLWILAVNLGIMCGYRLNKGIFLAIKTIKDCALSQNLDLKVQMIVFQYLPHMEESTVCSVELWWTWLERGVSTFCTVLADFPPNCLNYCCLTTLPVCIIPQLFMVLYWHKTDDK